MISSDLFTVSEFSPESFVKKKTLCYHYTLTLALLRNVPASLDMPDGYLFLITPGFCLPPPVETSEIPAGAFEIKEIIEITFSDFLVELFQMSPFSSIGKFLKLLPGSRAFSSHAWNQVRDLLIRLRTDNGIEASLQFLQAINLLAKADDTSQQKGRGIEPVYSQQIAKRIEQIRNYLMENYHRPIQRSEVQKITGLSSSSFWRFFNRYMGLNFNDYVNAIRVEKSSRLLLTTDDTIASIAYSCGFNTPSYFNDVFRQFKGTTPGKLRSLHLASLRSP